MGNDPVSGKPMVVKDGRFGPYVTDGETNASLRKADSVEELTDERAAELLAERRAPAARRPKKRTTKPTTTKAATATSAKAARQVESPQPSLREAYRPEPAHNGGCAAAFGSHSVAMRWSQWRTTGLFGSDGTQPLDVPTALLPDPLGGLVTGSIVQRPGRSRLGVSRAAPLARQPRQAGPWCAVAPRRRAKRPVPAPRGSGATDRDPGGARPRRLPRTCAVPAVAADRDARHTGPVPTSPGRHPAAAAHLPGRPTGSRAPSSRQAASSARRPGRASCGRADLGPVHVRCCSWSGWWPSSSCSVRRLATSATPRLSPADQAKRTSAGNRAIRPGIDVVTLAAVGRGQVGKG